MSGPRNRKLSKSDKILLQVFVPKKRLKKTMKDVIEKGIAVEHVLKKGRK